MNYDQKSYPQLICNSSDFPLQQADPFHSEVKVRNMFRTHSSNNSNPGISRLSRCIQTCAVAGAFLLITQNFTMADPLPSGQGHWPMRHDMPPGVNAKFAGEAGVVRPGTMQTVEFILPVKGKVTVYSNAYPKGVTQVAPCKVGLEVGHVHRVKFHDLEEMPGVDIFPSFEVIDKIHPPGNELDPAQHKFAVPLEITARELESVMQHRMVSKVIYLEDPKNAILMKRDGEKVYTEEFHPRDNLLKEADLRGRPLVIMRVGSRQISADDFQLLLGTGGQVTTGNISK